MLVGKQAKFVRGLSKGLTKAESAKLAGYSEKNASSIGSKLAKNASIIQALDKIGLNDYAIANGIKTNVEAGMGVKATADTSLRGLELAARLRGHLEREKEATTTNNTLIIGELKQLSDDDLNDRLRGLQGLILQGEEVKNEV